MEPIALPDATDIHHLRRRVYRVQGHWLIVPMSAPMFAAGLATLIVVQLLLRLLGLDLSLNTAVPLIALPCLAGWAADREDIQGRTFLSIAWAFTAYYLTPRTVVVQ